MILEKSSNSGRCVVVGMKLNEKRLISKAELSFYLLRNEWHHFNIK